LGHISHPVEFFFNLQIQDVFRFQLKDGHPRLSDAITPSMEIPEN